MVTYLSSSEAFFDIYYNYSSCLRDAYHKGAKVQDILRDEMFIAAHLFKGSLKLCGKTADAVAHFIAYCSSLTFI